MKKLTNRGLCTLIALSLLSGPAFEALAADNETLQFFEEEATVITASKKEEKAADAPGIITVVTSEQIRRFGAKNLRDVLDRAPSIYTLGSYLFPSSVVSMRGDLETHNDTHILWLINGRPTREVAFGGIDTPLLTAYPLELIDHIEIVRGPGSVLYGSNAYTGVINVITKQARENEAAVKGGGGSHNTGYEILSGQAPLQDGGVSGALRYYNSLGWPYSATDEKKVSGSMHTREEDTSFVLDSRYQNWTVTGFYSETHDRNLGTIPRWPADPVNIIRGMTDIGYKHPLSANWRTALNFTYNHQHTGGLDPGAVDESARDGNSFLTEASIQGEPIRDFHIIFGAVNDYHEVTFNPENIHPRETWWSLYTQADYRPVSFLKLLNGVQYNKPKGIGGNVSPRVGAIITINPAWGGKLLYGEAFRSPYPAETQFNSPSLQGNPNLGPETIRTYDAQVYHHSTSVQNALTYFHSYQTNRITRVIIGGVPTFQNSGTLTSQGFEFETTLNPTTYLSFVGSYMYQTNKNDHGVRDATFMPRNMVKTGVSYVSAAGVTAGLFNSYFSQRGNVNAISPAALQVNPPSDAYNWLTLNLSLDLHRLSQNRLLTGMTAGLYAENLLNEQVFDPEFNRRNINTLPARPGRSYYGDISLKF